MVVECPEVGQNGPEVVLRGPAVVLRVLTGSLDGSRWSLGGCA